MRYLMQFGLILVFSLVGEFLHALLPFPVPAAIYGLLLLFLALKSVLIKPGHIREASGWLIAIMPVLFVAPTVNLTGCWEVIAPKLLPIIVIIVTSTLLTFTVSGKVVDLLSKRRKETDSVD